MNSLLPSRNESHLIFWRPQKVGSSTILSILVSHSFRYNIVQRRRTAANSFCWKFAKCTIDFLEAETTKSQQQSMDLVAVLKQYKNINKRFTEKREVRADSMRYNVVLTHQLCNLPRHYISQAIPCAFLGGNELNQEMSRSLPSDLAHASRELFIVREPLSRAISIYYFWGELYRLKHGVASSSSSSASSLSESLSLKWKESKQPTKSKREKMMASGEVPTTATSRYFSKKELEQLGGLFSFGQRNQPEHEKRRILRASGGRKATKLRLGSGSFDRGMAEHVQGSLFMYHGNESTVPPYDIAMAYAQRFPIRAGMPGPSFTWSGFANSPQDALDAMKTREIMTLVTERLDESLVVASYYLKWSIADMVTILPRKSLSPHPKATAWPGQAVQMIREKLAMAGEYEIYHEAHRQLDGRIAALAQVGVNISQQVILLQALRNRVAEICLQEKYLTSYSAMLREQGYSEHLSDNKLRDGADVFNEQGHAFAFNGDLMYSYDVCGNCEAHALLLSLQKGLAARIETALTIDELPENLVRGNIDFANCIKHRIP